MFYQPSMLFSKHFNHILISALLLLTCLLIDCKMHMSSAINATHNLDKPAILSCTTAPQSNITWCQKQSFKLTDVLQQLSQPVANALASSMLR